MNHPFWPFPSQNPPPFNPPPNMTKLTIAQSTAAARYIRSKITQHSSPDVNGWQTDEALKNFGYCIPSTAYADGDDLRTQTNLAAWIRRYAVKISSETVTH